MRHWAISLALTITPGENNSILSLANEMKFREARRDAQGHTAGGKAHQVGVISSSLAHE